MEMVTKEHETTAASNRCRPRQTGKISQFWWLDRICIYFSLTRQRLKRVYRLYAVAVHVIALIASLASLLVWANRYTDWITELAILEGVFVLGIAIWKFVMGEPNKKFLQRAFKSQLWLAVIPIVGVAWLASLFWGTLHIHVSDALLGQFVHLKANRNERAIQIASGSTKVRLPLWHGSEYEVWFESDARRRYVLSPFAVRSAFLPSDLIRDAVIIESTELLARTVSNENGWTILVLRNGKVKCQRRPYNGQDIICGGAWKTGDQVVVLCLMPGGGSYPCGQAVFAPALKGITVTIDVPV